MWFPKYSRGHGKVGIGTVLLGYGMVFLIMIATAPYLESLIENPFLLYSISRGAEVSFLILFVSICMYPIKFPAKSIWLRPEAITHRRVSTKLILKLLLLGLTAEVIIQLFVAASSNLSDHQKFFAEMTRSLIEAEFPDSIHSLLIGEKSLLSHCLVAAIVEEIIFRGIFLNVLLSSFRTLFAVIVSSLIFATLHSNFLSAFLGSLFFSWVYLTYGRLWLCILMHSFGNLLLTVFFGFGGGALILHITEQNFLVLSFVLVVILIIALLYIRTHLTLNMKHVPIFIT